LPFGSHRASLEVFEREKIVDQIKHFKSGFNVLMYPTMCWFTHTHPMNWLAIVDQEISSISDIDMSESVFRLVLQELLVTECTEIN